MNCQEFQSHVHEYMDQALPAAALKAVEEHLASCESCRAALARATAFGQALHRHMTSLTAGLALRPESRLLINEMREPVPSRLSTNFGQLWFGLVFRPAVACIAVALVGWVVFRAYHPSAEGPNEAINSPSVSWVVDVPMQTETHILNTTEGHVIDAVLPSVALGHARWTAPDNSSKPL